jgi:hypothetical protein
MMKTGRLQSYLIVPPAGAFFIDLMNFPAHVVLALPFIGGG